VATVAVIEVLVVLEAIATEVDVAETAAPEVVEIVDAAVTVVVEAEIVVDPEVVVTVTTVAQDVSVVILTATVDHVPIAQSVQNAQNAQNEMAEMTKAAEIVATGDQPAVMMEAAVEQARLVDDNGTLTLK